MSDAFELEICQGKYRYRYEAGKQEVWRNGDIWPTMNGKLIGDKFVFSLAVELDEALKERDTLRADKATLQHMTYSLKDRLEVAEKDSAHHKALAESALRVAKGWEDKCDELRAKIEQMEQPEQARLVTPTAYRWRHRGSVMWQYGELTEETVQVAKEHNHEVQSLYALLGAQPAPSVPNGWKEAAIAWEVCASIHREYGKGKDPFFNTRQGDFVKHANDARAMLAVAPEAKL